MGKGKKVLIIDDEIDLCLLLKGYFLRKNFEVLISNTLNEGLSFLQKTKPDILFIDNNLPDGAGWQKVPDLATEYPDMFICLVSAFHPAPPLLSPVAKYTVIEKPISLGDLDNHFSSL